MRTYLKVCIVMKMLSLTILLHKALPMCMCSFDICDQSSDDRCSPLAFGVVNVGLTDQITLISYVINYARQSDLS